MRFVRTIFHLPVANAINFGVFEASLSHAESVTFAGHNGLVMKHAITLHQHFTKFHPIISWFEATAFLFRILITNLENWKRNTCGEKICHFDNQRKLNQCSARRLLTSILPILRKKRGIHQRQATFMYKRKPQFFLLLVYPLQPEKFDWL